MFVSASLATVSVSCDGFSQTRTHPHLTRCNSVTTLAIQLECPKGLAQPLSVRLLKYAALLILVVTLSAVKCAELTIRDINEASLAV